MVTEMKQRMTPGIELDFITPDELVNMIPRPAQITRIRASANVDLDGNGNGTGEIYKVPNGYSFDVRRVFLTITGATSPGSGNVALNVAALFVAYRRSGTIIEYANPKSAMGIASIPGAQSWGDQQGPYLRNGEVFEVQAGGLTANAILLVSLEGILRRPSTEEQK